MSDILYFSYGSNMSHKRLLRRAPLARAVCTAKLVGHTLQFHKSGRDGSAKCDALYTKDLNDSIVGVVFQLQQCDKLALDRIEGLGRGYQEKQVAVLAELGDTIEATSYFATDIDASLKPYHWYKEHVLIGAKENKLPTSYIQSLEMVASIKDPDYDRQKTELAIYE